jgi:polysaccharide biosynthesis protein PslG
LIPRARTKSNIAARLPALLLVTSFFLAIPWHSSAQTEGGSGATVPENSYGVNVFLHKEVEEWKIDKTLQMVAEANIPYIKQEFPWQEIEFKKDYFHDDKWDKSAWEKFDRIVDMAQKYNLKIIARVSHPPEWAKANDGSGPLKDNKDLADYTNALLDHYQGKIRHVQVWNEPNLSAEWVPGQAVDPKGYADMMKVVYPTVKEAHPDAVILSAPLAITLEGTSLRGNMNDIDYWRGLYGEGIKGNFDIASANAYGLDQPPDAPPGPRLLNFRRVELLRQLMVDNGDDKPIWLNEYAWNASPETLPEEEKNYWRHVSEEQQAEWTVEGVDYARTNWPWAGVISIWYFRQVGDIPDNKAEYYFRMVNPDFSTAPVYDAVKADALTYPGPAAQGQENTPEPAPTASQQPEASPVATSSVPVEATATAPAQATLAPAGSSPTVATPAATAGTATASPATATATVAPGAVAGQEGGNTLLLVLGGALVVAGLAGLAYYYMRSRPKPT